MKTINLTDQRFGKLVVLNQIRKYRNKYTMWLCICDCGNINQVRAGHLISGVTKSCGCVGRPIANNLVGKVFGYLTINELLPHKPQEKIRYLCKCKCGSTTIAQSHSLIKGEKKSCGCWSLVSHVLRNTGLKPEDVPIELVKTYMVNRKLIKILKQKGSKQL